MPKLDMNNANISYRRIHISRVGANEGFQVQLPNRQRVFLPFNEWVNVEYSDRYDNPAQELVAALGDGLSNQVNFSAEFSSGERLSGRIHAPTFKRMHAAMVARILRESPMVARLEMPQAAAIKSSRVGWGWAVVLALLVGWYG